MKKWLIKQLSKSETLLDLCCAVISESGMTVTFNYMGGALEALFEGNISDQEFNDVANRKISLEDAIARAAARNTL
ncbi:TPA: hypothetical protein QD004_002419 [Shewanella algae]|uniref:hypothetical protein n=1 Tax=Shewanella algae TaxID=38313 RepID=UPI001AADD053|nr:hypothetical protein [Shewanella algae]MBO2552622.1 hypothetical protein [Shewanella algae]HDS1203126.1 hypothetical protein [Shewanella algae]